MIKYELVGYNNDVNLNTLDLPLYVYLELTESCNFRCKFCSVSDKSKKYMDLDLLKNILVDLKKNKIMDIYYTGGEPMLHPNFKKIVLLASELGFRQTVLTNGSLLKKYEDILDKLMCVCVSLHGDEKTHDYLTKAKSYKDLVSVIPMVKKYTNIKINYTVMNENQDIKQMKHVLDLAKKLDIGVSFAKYNNIGLGKKNDCYIDLEKFVKNMDLLHRDGYKFSVNDCVIPCLIKEELQYLSHGCGAGYLFASITCDGNIKICPSSREELGNIKKGFKKVWMQPALKEYRKFKWIPLYCKSCKNLSKCRCGCKIELAKGLNKFNDFNVEENKNKMWNNIKDKQMFINMSLIREESEGYVNLSNPPRKFNKEALKIIQQLNDGVVPNEIENSKELVLSMYRDKLIEEVE